MGGESMRDPCPLVTRQRHASHDHRQGPGIDHACSQALLAPLSRGVNLRVYGRAQRAVGASRVVFAHSTG